MGYLPYQLVIAGFLNHQQYWLIWTDCPRTLRFSTCAILFSPQGIKLRPLTLLNFAGGKKKSRLDSWKVPPHHKRHSSLMVPSDHKLMMPSEAPWGTSCETPNRWRRSPFHLTNYFDKRSSTTQNRFFKIDFPPNTPSTLRSLDHQDFFGRTV